ncbi:ly6/PLAUR domain-containing protein 1 isoform X2 [Oreochromis niloticus]|uniref:ly6/PLAUR domain-containing protein 1 isoform X2 n=1 Tax=Oreochromis niloticus TaxID=8128 RepID=UPI000DF34D72|nr:ly6/PLAUR domain-containing protein 1 isoform X2 [Oreochromis niloticus]
MLEGKSTGSNLLIFVHNCSYLHIFLKVFSKTRRTAKCNDLAALRGVHYRKSCASSGACLIASSGYQQFCTGKLNSVCISCCNTPLCNGPRQKKRPQPSAAITLNTPRLPVLSFNIIILLSSILC